MLTQRTALDWKSLQAAEGQRFKILTGENPPYRWVKATHELCRLPAFPVHMDVYPAAEVGMLCPPDTL